MSEPNLREDLLNLSSLNINGNISAENILIKIDEKIMSSNVDFVEFTGLSGVKFKLNCIFRNRNATVWNQLYAGHSNFTVSNITSIRINAEIFGAISTGSRLILYQYK